MTTEGTTIDSFPTLETFDPAAVFYTVVNDQDYQISGAQLVTLLSQNLTQDQLPSSVVTETKLASKVREQLIENKVFYVRKDGSDTNIGSANNANGAFLTIQAAINKAVTYDFGNTGNFTISINVGPGIYEENLTLYPVVNGERKSVMGSNWKIELIGDIVNPKNVILKPITTGYGVRLYGNGANYKFAGFEINGEFLGNYAYLIFGNEGSKLELGAVSLKFNGSNQSGVIASGRNTLIYFNYQDITVEGNGFSLFGAQTYAKMEIAPASLKFINNPSFEIILYLNTFSVMNFQHYTLQNGLVLGKRWAVYNFSDLLSYSEVGALPGTIEGTIDSSSRLNAT